MVSYLHLVQPSFARRTSPYVVRRNYTKKFSYSFVAYTLFVPHPSNRGGLSGEAQFAYGGDERGIGQEPGGLSEKPREQRRFGGREVRDEDDGDSGTRGGDDDGLLVHGLFSFFVVTNPIRVLIRRTENFLLQKDIHRRSDQNPNGVKRFIRSLCE